MLASFGATESETLIFTDFREKKRHLDKFEVMGSHLNLFQS